MATPDALPEGWTSHGGEVRGSFTESHVGCVAWTFRLLVTPLVFAICAFVLLLGLLSGDVPEGDVGDVLAWAWSPGKRPLKVRLTQTHLQVGHQRFALRHVKSVHVTPTALTVRLRFHVRRWAIAGDADHLDLEWLAEQVRRLRDPSAPGREAVPGALSGLGIERER